MTLSSIIPVFNEGDVVGHLKSRLTETVSQGSATPVELSRPVRELSILFAPEGGFHFRLGYQSFLFYAKYKFHHE